LKNLGRTIDKILKIDPTLEEKLNSIKNKWKKTPAKTLSCWKELLEILNSDPLLHHPKRNEIKMVINPKKRASRTNFTSFEQTSPGDKFVGVIPENIADDLRRHNRQSIAVAKLNTEASLTRNMAIAAEVARKETILLIYGKDPHFSSLRIMKIFSLLLNRPNPLCLHH
jgi:hypothetical protein